MIACNVVVPCHSLSGGPPPHAFAIRRPSSRRSPQASCATAVLRFAPHLRDPMRLPSEIFPSAMESVGTLPLSSPEGSDLPVSTEESGIRVGSHRPPCRQDRTPLTQGESLFLSFRISFFCHSSNLNLKTVHDTDWGNNIIRLVNPAEYYA
jgi:hypothetical protein